MEYSQSDSRELISIIDTHLKEASGRVDVVNTRYFSTPRPVFSRHLRNWKDAPRDIAQPFLGAWNFVVRKPTKKSPIFLNTRKQAETTGIIINELLDFSALEEKIQAHLLPFQTSAKSEIEPLLEKVPQELQDRTEKELKIALENLSVPVEMLRDLAAMVLISSAATAWGGNKFAFGSVLAGQSIATSIWAANLGWFGSAIYSAAGLFGISTVPGWVAGTGAAGGVLAGIILIPLIGPVCEWGVGTFKGRKVLERAIGVARSSLLGEDPLHRPDRSTVVSKVYQYGDMLKNLIDTVRLVVL